MAASKLHRLPLKLCVSGLSQQCAALGRHLRESPGDKARLQLASQSLLRGITHLVELGEECVAEGQTSRVHSRRRLQAALCRRQVFFSTALFKQSSPATLAKYSRRAARRSLLMVSKEEYNPLTAFKQLMDPCLGRYLCAAALMSKISPQIDPQTFS